MMDFHKQRVIGNISENKIAHWLMQNFKCAVLPLYDIEMETGKGERVFTARQSFVSPDLLAVGDKDVYWIEAKHKSVFSWHRITQRWVTGIDLHHWQQYQELASRVTGTFMILFLHQEAYGNARNEPYPCPTGLFGANIETLVSCENHRHDNWGKTGMVYWAHHTLTRYATVDQVNAAHRRYLTATTE